jgi:hypothetical protein
MTLHKRLPAGQLVAELSESTSVSHRTEPAGWVIMCVFTEEGRPSIARAVDGLRFMESRILYEPLVAAHHRADRSRVAWHYFRERCYAEGASTASVAESVGARAAVSAERCYAARALPRAAFGELSRLVSGAGAVRLAQLGALTVGFTWTVAGYLSGRAMSANGRWQRRRKGARWHRVWTPR